MSDLTIIELIKDAALFGGTIPNERIEEAKMFFDEQEKALNLASIT